MNGFTLATILAASVHAAPVQPPSQAAAPLTFSSDVRMIRLDVSVVDGSGRPVRGLTAEDFRVQEEGHAVEVAVFEAMEDGSLATSPRSEAAPLGSLAVRQDAPRGPLGQRIVIVADPSGLTPMQLARVRQAIADFVALRARDGDSVRLVNLATREAWEGRIPADRARLAAMGRSVSRRRNPRFLGTDTGALPDSFDFDEEADVGAAYSSSVRTERFLSQFSRTGELLSLFDEILIQLSAVPGRKSLILISEGFPALNRLEERLQRTSHLAREAQASIHFVDAFGLDGLLPQGAGQKLESPFTAAWARSSGSQDLAEATGGFVSRFANTLTGALSRAAEEGRSYYIVGYVPAHRDDGRFRRVKVRVNRKGVTVRTKKGYIAGGLVSRRAP